VSAWRDAVRELREVTVALHTLADEWGLRLRHYAGHARARWLTLESTTGQVLACAAMSVVAAWLLVTIIG
jgi:hypothetical protein